MKTFLRFLIILAILFKSQETYGQQNSENGFSLPVTGTIKVLLVWAEVTASFTQPSSVPNYGEGILPSNHNDYFDPTFASGIEPTAYISKYFYEQSMGLQIVLGDHLDHVVQVHSFSNGYTDIYSYLNSLMNSGTFNDKLVYNSPSSSFDQYAIINSAGNYTPGFPKPNTSNNKIDCVIIFWSNTLIGHGMLPHNPIFQIGAFTGVENDCAFSNTAPNFVIQEYFHGMFGGNNWHNGNGAGDHTFPFITNPWGVCTQSSGAGMSNVASGYDRYHLGWHGWSDVNRTVRKTDLITAYNSVTGLEENTLDLTPSPGIKKFILRDQVTYGDALRIKLPHINFTAPGDVKNQYLWIENHQLITYFDHDFGYHEATLTCKENWTPGIYYQIQVGKNYKTPDLLTNPAIQLYPSQLTPFQPNSLASFLFPLTAEGNYDFAFGDTSNQIGVPCVWQKTTPIIKYDPNTLPNPLTGFSDVFGFYNSDANDKLDRQQDIYYPGSSEIDQLGNLVFNYHKAGDTQDAFSFANGFTKLSIATNPSTAPVYTFKSKDNVHYNDVLTQVNEPYENRKIWLNGISVEILSENVNPAIYGPGAVEIQVRFDDYNIDRDVRWCADYINLSPNDFNVSQPSLIINAGKTVHLDRGRSATRHRATGQDPTGTWLFTQPTFMTCLPNSYVEMNSGSTMIIDNGSTLDFKGSSKIILRSNSKIIVRNGSRLVLEPSALLQVENGARVIIESGGTLEYQEGAKIQLNGINAVLEIQGMLDIKDNANFTFGHTTITHGYVLFNNTTLSPSRNITVGTNCSMTFNGYSSLMKVLVIEQETMYAPDELTSFTISKGTVVFGDGSRLQPPAGRTSIVNLNLAKFTSNTPGVNNGHRGVQFYGQPNVNVSNCTFEYGKYGINANNTSGGASITINNSTFRKCDWGVKSQDKGITLNSCNFFNCDVGWEGYLMSLPSRTVVGNVGGTHSSANVTGYKYESGSTAPLSIKDPMIFANNTGVDLPTTSFVSAYCGTVSNNNFGFSVGLGASLQMDAGVSINGGQVTAHNIITINADHANNLYLNQGFNDLSTLNQGTNSCILGSFINPASIAANQNKWNRVGTFGPMDYDAWWIGTGNPPVSIIDQQPQASIVACGQANPPCNTPCDNLKDALGYCPLCDIINTDDFHYEKLNVASKEAIDKAKSTDPNNYTEAVDLFYQILMKHYQNPDEKEKYILRLSYYKMAEALGNAFGVGQITGIENQQACQTQVQEMIDVQNKFIDEATASNDYYNRFFYSYDKALTYRLADRRDLALSLLDELSGWVENPQEINIVSKARCSILIEQQVLTNEIEKEYMEENLQTCKGVSFRLLPQLSNTIPDNSIVEEEKYAIYPNPAQDELTIISTIEHGTISLINLVGQKLLSTKLNFDSFIDLAQYPRGIYVFEIENTVSHKKYHETIVLE